MSGIHSNWRVRNTPPGSITHDRKIDSAALYEKLCSKVKQCNDKKENKTVNTDFYCLKLYIDFYYSRVMSIELKRRLP